MLDTFAWEDPEFLLLLLVIPILMVWYWLTNLNKHPELRISTLGFFQGVRKGFRVNFRHSLFVLRLAGLVFLIVALARPQTRTSWQNSTTEGIDIVMVQDISSSMLAEDFKPNRLEASKKLALDFIGKRRTDRIGLVIFSGDAFTQVPLTTDHAIIRDLFLQVKNGMVEDGTAIGMGLATAVNRLKQSEAVSKVIILLTDGVNTSGNIAPLTAAELAKEFDVRVYTIGVGSNEMAPFPVKTPFGVQYQYQKAEIDEATLDQIASMTGGKYYRATTNENLREIYQEIDLLEKSKIDVIEFRKKTESFFPIALMGCIFLILEFFLRNTLLRSIP